MSPAREPSPYRRLAGESLSSLSGLIKFGGRQRWGTGDMTQAASDPMSVLAKSTRAATSWLAPSGGRAHPSGFDDGYGFEWNRS